MILSTRVQNRSKQWSALLKPRVTDVVQSEGDYYINLTGINSDVSNSVNWFKFYNSRVPVPVDKTADDITASGGDWIIDLTADGVPAFPATTAVYVDINGDGNYQPLSPVNYNPVTRILSGMNSKIDYPDQKVKIIIL